MIIESIIREYDYCGIVGYTPEHVYNAWKRGNTLQFYFLIRIRNGKIKLVIDGVAFTLYSHDELINTIRCAFPDNCHDITTIVETLLYV